MNAIGFLIVVASGRLLRRECERLDVGCGGHDDPAADDQRWRHDGMVRLHRRQLRTSGGATPAGIEGDQCSVGVRHVDHIAGNRRTGPRCVGDRCGPRGVARGRSAAGRRVDPQYSVGAGENDRRVGRGPADGGPSRGRFRRRRPMELPVIGSSAVTAPVTSVTATSPFASTIGLPTIFCARVLTHAGEPVPTPVSTNAVTVTSRGTKTRRPLLAASPKGGALIASGGGVPQPLDGTL